MELKAAKLAERAAKEAKKPKAGDVWGDWEMQMVDCKPSYYNNATKERRAFPPPGFKKN